MMKFRKNPLVNNYAEDYHSPGLTNLESALAYSFQIVLKAF